MREDLSDIKPKTDAQPPEDGSEPLRYFFLDFIKVFVGLPSEHITIKDGRVTIYNAEHPDGLLLEEPYLASQNIAYGNIDRKLGKDEFFVLGDNRLSSSDSRVW